MISSKDRSYYFGASDTSMIVGSWETKSFEKWWLEKLGLRHNTFTNESMQTGTAYEHAILDFINVLEKDKQVIKGRLRVNLDGNTVDKIEEVKTYEYSKGFKVSKKYREQVIVQMYCTGYRKAEIVAYGLIDSDYKNFFNMIDKDRLSFHQIEYDQIFINKEYKPKLKYLTKCLIKGIFPKTGGETNENNRANNNL
jgi:hypothetical protein